MTNASLSNIESVETPDTPGAADSAASIGQRAGHYVAAHVFEASALALTLITGLAYVVGRSYLNGWEEAAGVPGLMFRRDLSDVMLGGATVARVWMTPVLLAVAPFLIMWVNDGARPSASEEPAAVWFAYTPDRRGEHPQQHLAHFAGVLQADAFAGYAELYLDGRVRDAACMAHARRKIHDLHAVRPNAVTQEALRRIGALYKIEEDIRGKPPDERRSVRQERAAPLLDDMKRWFEATLATLSAKSDTTKAIRYALNRWPALVYYYATVEWRSKAHRTACENMPICCRTICATGRLP